MAKYIIQDGQLADVVRAGINANSDELYAAGIDYGMKSGDSLMFSGQKSFKIAPILTDGVGQEDLEFINIGNWNPNPQGGESRNLVPAGIFRSIGNALLFRNRIWNNSLQQFQQYDTSADAYGSCSFEAGGEGCNMNHVPPGTHSHPVGMGFSVRGDGSRGAETDGVVTGYVNQSMAKIFLAFETTVSGLKYWSNPAAEPMLWIQSKEVKDTYNEFSRYEGNGTGVFGGHYFAASRGTMESKTVLVANDVTGRIGWKAYDGNSYEITAVIEAQAKGTISDGNIGQSLLFKTSATTYAGLNTLLELGFDNKIGFFAQAPVARQVVPTGSTADDIITALQNLGLFSQT